MHEAATFLEQGGDAGEATPRLLDPVDAVACAAGRTSHEIRRIDNVKSYGKYKGGSVSLRCGTATAGYEHIKDRHERDWKNIIAKVGGGGKWDDLMFFTAVESLNAPDKTTDRLSGKLCYTAPIHLLNQDMVPVYSFHPTIIISTNNKIVITAFPGGGC